MPPRNDLKNFKLPPDAPEEIKKLFAEGKKPTPEQLELMKKYMPKRGADNPLQTMKRLLGNVWKNHKLGFVFVVILIIVAAITNTLGTYYYGRIIDVIGQMARGTEGLRSTFIWLLVTMLGVYMLSAVTTYLYGLIMTFIAQKTLKRIRDDMFAHMQKLPLRFFDTNTHGSLMSRYTNDTDALRQMLTQTLPQIISSVITVISTFVLMVYSSVSLTVVALIFLVGILTITRKVGGKSAVFFLKQQTALGSLNGYIEEMIEGQKVVKVFCHEEKAIEEFERLNENLRVNATNANKITNIMGPLMNNLGYLQYIVIAVLGASLAMIGTPAALSLYGLSQTGSLALSLGAVVSYLTYVRNFNQPVQQVSQQFNFIIMALAGAERIYEVMDTEPEDMGGKITLTKVKYVPEHERYEECEDADEWAWKVPSDKGFTEYVKLRGDIRLNDVVFGYVPNKVVLNNVSLYAKPGQKIAFVGSTGAGKTTITNLINRFYDIQEGEILYDGLPIRSIHKDDLRRSLGVVLQDTHLFTGTVMDNIRYGRLDATDEECIEAAKLANAHFFIEHLPEGYETMLYSDGANLSQGQRQLLAIARAMVSRCPVLVLDEATSSIDTRTEKLIEQGLDKLMEGRTVFVIAHRLSTVRNSRAIMVLEHGNIIERGNHEQLIAQHGKYYSLYTGAFELD